jgi:fibronectin type 3 domain-containing protein
MSPAEQLDWSNARYATSYDLYKNGSFYHAIAGGGDLYTFIGVPVVAGSTNSYYVVAKNAAGTTNSNTVTFTIPADICVTMPPVAVLSASVQCGSAHQPLVSLNWTLVPAAFGWQLYRDGTPYATPHTGLHYADTNVVSGHTYTYNVATYALSAPLSNPVSVEVSDSVCVPAAVTVTATAFCNGDAPAVRLFWNASDNGATYTVLRGSTTLASGLRDPSYIDFSPVTGTTYTYQVIATNGTASAPPAPATIHISDDVCPPSPFTTSALAFCSNGTPSVLLNWSRSAHAASYTVYRNDVQIGGPLPSSASEFVDVAPAGFNLYGIKATNAAGSYGSGASSFASPAACASAPVTFAASAIATCSNGKQAVRIQWSAASGATSYTVIRNGATLPALPSTATSYEDAAVSAGQDYTYRVVATNGPAYNTANSTAPAGTVTPSSADCPPGAFTLVALAGCTPSVALAWTPPPNNVSNFTIFRNQASVATVAGTTFTYSEESALPSGSYSYFVRAIGFGGVSDSNKYDVIVDRTVCTGPSPNLTAVDIKPSVLTGRAGDVIAVDVEFANAGNTPAIPATARIRFGRGPSMSPSDPLLMTIPLLAMSSGSDVTRSVDVKLPAVAAGTYYLFLTLDEEHLSGESKLDDNVKASAPFNLGEMIPPKHRAAGH